jgi:hypothetical protein
MLKASSVRDITQSLLISNLLCDQGNVSFLMTVAEQILEDLEGLPELLCDVSLNGLVLDLRKKVPELSELSELSMQIELHQDLENAAQYLSRPQESTCPLNIQARVRGLIRATYGRLESGGNKARWQTRKIDYATFLLIGLSYTPQDIVEMDQTGFNYLIGKITKSPQIEALPPKRIFHKEIELAVAEEAELLEDTGFRRSMCSSSRSREISDMSRIFLFHSIIKGCSGVVSCCFVQLVSCPSNYSLSPKPWLQFKPSLLSTFQLVKSISLRHLAEGNEMHSQLTVLSSKSKTP